MRLSVVLRGASALAQAGRVRDYATDTAETARGAFPTELFSLLLRWGVLDAAAAGTLMAPIPFFCLLWAPPALTPTPSAVALSKHFFRLFPILQARDRAGKITQPVADTVGAAADRVRSQLCLAGDVHRQPTST